MPIQHAIWTVGKDAAALSRTRLDSEKQLEEMIVQDSSILSSEWMLIGRQLVTSHGGVIDLLAIAPDGSLVLIELKRDRTPRKIMAQALDYASWVEDLQADQISQIYERYSAGGNLDKDFLGRFGDNLDEETLNQSHQIIIVAAELDGATERIVGYLNARDIAINVVFFEVFQHGKEKLLSHAWLIDPGETQVNVASTTKVKGKKEPWNGEFYVSYGPSHRRSWDEARKFGYISAGGGSWYSQTLKLLSPGDRVWVNVPKSGYVGVGRVTEAVCALDDFKVETPKGKRPAVEVLDCADKYKLAAEDPNKAEYFVAIQWLDSVPEGGCNERGWALRHATHRLQTYDTQMASHDRTAEGQVSPVGSRI
jgi:Endonuclease NucS C-terminal domain